MKSAKRSIGQRNDVVSSLRTEGAEPWWRDYSSPEEAEAAMSEINTLPMQPVAGPNYKFFHNLSTGYGELHVGNYQIPMRPEQAKLFADAGAQLRATMLPNMVRDHEATLANYRAKRAAR